MFHVDAHHHLWDLSVRDQPWITEEFAPIRRTFTAEDLVAAAVGVDATVVVQTVSDPRETPELLATANPLIAGVVGWIDLTAPDAGERLAALRSERLVGIRHQVQDEPDPRWLCRPDVRAGLAVVAREGLVYDLLTLPAQLPAAIETVRALPDLQFVVDHLSKPPIATGEREPWASQIRELAGHENVACKLSGMVTEADWAAWTIDDLRPYADVVLDAFGPHRLLFGSDWPVCLLAASYAAVSEAAEALTAGLSAAERELVFGGTARRVYGLRAGTLP